MNQKTFALEGREYVELKNLVKIMGYVYSGGEAKMIILDGQITVNDEVELRRGKKLKVGDVIGYEKDQITIEA